MGKQLQLAALAGLSLVVGTGADCCGVGAPELAARYDPYQGCYLYDCPIAVGAEQQIFVQTYDARDEYRIKTARLADPSLAEIEVFHNDVLVRPHAAGTTSIDTTLVGGGDIPGTLRFADRAVTRTVAPSMPAGSSPTRPQIYAGSTMVLIADHRDAMDTPLLGHGLEQWSVTGGTLREVPPAATTDSQRTRYATVAEEGKRLVVKARPDATAFEADIVQAGSAQKIVLTTAYARLVDQGALTVYSYQAELVGVEVYSAANRRLFGAPRRAGLTVSVDNPAIAIASVVDGKIQVQPMAFGSATLTVSFDGLTRRYRLNVQ